MLDGTATTEPDCSVPLRTPTFEGERVKNKETAETAENFFVFAPFTKYSSVLRGLGGLKKSCTPRYRVA
jgi:hypothetical protein